MKKTEVKNYYLEQIEKVIESTKKFEYKPQIKVVSEDNQTKWLSITLEQLQKIADIFKN